MFRLTVAVVKFTFLFACFVCVCDGRRANSGLVRGTSEGQQSFGSKLVPLAPVIRNLQAPRVRTYSGGMLAAGPRDVLASAVQGVAAKSRVIPQRQATVARASSNFPWDASEMPKLPETPTVMSVQAADAVTRAYQAGFTRQNVRFDLGHCFDFEQLYLKGNVALLNASLPTMKFFVEKIWGGEGMTQIKTSFIDEDTGTLLYREAQNAMQDVAVVHMPGRTLVTESRMLSFFQDMKDRLVVLTSTELAAEPFKVEAGGKDFESSTGREICKMFAEQSYYYQETNINQWKTTIFRAFPFKWQVWIENLDKEKVLLLETDTRPSFAAIDKVMLDYDEENNILAIEKVAKNLKEAQKQEEESDRLDPGWRSQASGEELEKRAKERQKGQRLAEKVASEGKD